MRFTGKIRERAALASPTSGALYWAWYSKRKLCYCLIGFAALVVVMGATCGTAYAFDLLDPINDLFDDWATSLEKSAYDWLTSMLMKDQMMNDFSSLLGKKSGAYGAITTVKKQVIDSVGYIIVGFCALVKMVQISSRFDSNGVAVEIREVFFLMLYCIIFFTLIDNSLGICEGIYDWVNGVMGDVDSQFGNTAINMTESDFTKLFEKTPAGMELKGIVLIVILLLALLLTVIGGVVVWFVTTARYLQIYAFTLVAPIPLAFLANDETKQWGTGFLKNYLAVCLAGLFLVFIVDIYPYLLAAAGSMNLLAVLGSILVYLFALIKSGAWARDILGG